MQVERKRWLGTASTRNGGVGIGNEGRPGAPPVRRRQVGGFSLTSSNYPEATLRIDVIVLPPG